MKKEINAFIEHIKAHHYFALFTHSKPDGDAVGGVLALKFALETLGKKVDCFVQGPLKESLMVSEAIHSFEDIFEDRAQDCLIAIDCASLDYLYSAEQLPQGRKLLVVDHHYTNLAYGDVNVVDPRASSVGEVIYQILKEAKIPVTGEIANAIYLSLVSDTWYFSFANTTPKSLRIVADLMEDGLDFMRLNEIIKARSLEKFELLGIAQKHAEVRLDGRAIFLYIPGENENADTEGIVDSARNVKGCLFAALITQIHPQEFRGSLRSNSDLIDVSKIALRYGGGGHKRAAGLTFLGEKEDLFNALEAFVRECLS